jgi:hypothetical protein
LWGKEDSREEDDVLHVCEKVRSEYSGLSWAEENRQEEEDDFISSLADHLDSPRFKSLTSISIRLPAIETVSAAKTLCFNNLSYQLLSAHISNPLGRSDELPLPATLTDDP